MNAFLYPKDQERVNLMYGVDVRINRVDNSEINYLMSVLQAMKNEDLQEAIINSSDGEKAFVVKVKTGELNQLKSALRAVLQVVKPERVDIET